MAKIPSASFGRQLSVDVPRQAQRSTSIARAQGEALGDFGRGVSSLGQGIGNIVEQRRKAEDDAFISTLKADLQVRRLEREKAEKTNISMKGEDPTGYAQRSQEFLDEQKEVFSERARSQSQKQFIDFYFKNEKGLAAIKDSQYEANARIEHFTRQKDISRKNRINAVMSSSSMEEAVKAYREQTVDTFSSNLLSPEARQRELQRDKGILTGGLDSMLLNGKSSIIEGLNFLEGKNPNMKQELDALGEDRLRYLQKFKRAEEIERNKAVNEAVTQTSNLASLAELEFQKSGIVSPATKERISDSIEGLSRLEQTDRVVKAKEVAKNTLENMDFMEDLKYMTVDQINKIDPTEGIDLSNPKVAEIKLAALKQKNHLLSQYRKELKQDPAGVVLREDKTLKEGSQELIEKQKARGISNPRIFSESTETRIKEELLNSPNNKAAVLDNVLSNYELSKQGLSQMAYKDKSMIPFSMAANFENKLIKTQMLDLNPGEINQRYAAEISDDDSNIKNAINNQLNDISIALGRNDAVVNSIKESALTMVKNRVLNSRGEDIEDTIESVLNNTFKKELTAIRVGESAVLLQGKSQQYKQKVEGFLNLYADPLFIDDFLDEIPFELKDLNLAKDTYASSKEFLEDQMDNETFKWVVSPSGDGLIPTYEDPAIFKQVAIFTKNEQGHRIPIEIKYSDLTNPNGKFHSLVQAEIESSIFDDLSDTSSKTIEELKKSGKKFTEEKRSLIRRKFRGNQ